MEDSRIYVEFLPWLNLSFVQLWEGGNNKSTNKYHPLFFQTRKFVQIQKINKWFGQLGFRQSKFVNLLLYCMSNLQGVRDVILEKG